MMKAFLCVCAALAITTLLGCGGGGDKPNALITTSPYAWPGIANGSLVFEWKAVDAHTMSVSLTATNNDKATGAPGWLAIAWTPDGKMDHGDFVIGYASNCVRSLTNGAVRSVPTGVGNFTVSDASFSVVNNVMQLNFTRPIGGATPGLNPIVADGNFVITAAGSITQVPADCNVALTKSNVHDMENFVQGGSKFGLLSTPAPPTPPTPPAPKPPAPTPAPPTPPAPKPESCDTNAFQCQATHSVKGGDHVPSQAACCDKCKATDGCGAWSWTPASYQGRCTLWPDCKFHTSTPPVYQKNTVSGIIAPMPTPPAPKPPAVSTVV